MSINNRGDFLAKAAADGYIVTDHLLSGRNLQLSPGTYIPDFDTGEVDSATFKGTAGRDTLFGGGGEVFTFFLGSRGDDLYGTAVFTSAYVDYSGAKTGVHVDMSFRGSRTFTDAGGEERTVSIVGKARDGFGGTDWFTESTEPGLEGFGSILGVFGSSRRDVMIAGGGFDEFYGGRGGDLLIGGFSHGGDGDDRLIGRATFDFQYAAYGEEGDDLLLGTDFIDFDLIGGAGNDRILAGGGDDGSGRGRFVSVTGNEGNDHVDGGAGDDFIDGGVGKDVLVSGSGNDIINPDVELFQTNPDQARDGSRDIVRVTGDDLGDFTDVVLSRSFEAGRDQIRFREAVAGGSDWRIYHEAQTINDLTGLLYRSDDLAGVRNTILQIDADGDGLGGATPDSADYFLVVLDADLEVRDYLLT